MIEWAELRQNDYMLWRFSCRKLFLTVMKTTNHIYAKITQLAIVIIFFSSLAACQTTGTTLSTGGEGGPDGFSAPFLSDMTLSEMADSFRMPEDRSLFVIVHPAYYFFVQRKAARWQRENDPVVYDFMLRQMANERNFIHRAGRNGVPVLLVLPGKKYSKPYMEYINSLSRDSDSVVLLRSRSRNVGELTREDTRAFKTLVGKLGVQRVLLGGGYIGRCQEHVYKAVSLVLDTSKVSIGPEISAFAPKDISAETLQWLSLPDGTLNRQEMTTFIDAHRMNRAGEHANVTYVSARNDLDDLCLAGWNSAVCEDDLTASLPQKVPAF